MRPEYRPLIKGSRALALSCILILIFVSSSSGKVRQKGGDAYARYQGVRIGTISIRFHEFNRNEKAAGWEQAVRSLIRFKEGDRFSTSLFDDSTEAIALLKKFSDVRPALRLEGGALVVEYHLTPYRFVKNIVIRGNGSVLESDIIAVMTMHAGNVFKPEQLPEQEKLVRDKLIAEGFIDPAVSARAAMSTRDGNYTVYITIQRGGYYTYGDLTITGNRAVPGLAIRYMLFSETFRFIENEFRNNIAAVKKHYWKNGYPEADIIYTLNRDRASGRVDIAITVHEGPKYKIDFSGNRQFWKITLKKSVTLAEQGNKNDTIARKNAQSIASRYKSKGYPYAQVKLDIRKTQEDGKERKALTFVIEEGPRVFVERLEINGVQSTSEKKIRSLMRTAASGIFFKKVYDPDVLNNDILVIKSFYTKNGFMDALVTPYVRLSRDRTKATVQIEIVEGPRTLISSIEFKGNRALTDADILKKLDLKPGVPFQESAVAGAENQISSLFSAKGYPYVTVKGSTVMNDDRSRAAILFTINEGTLVLLGSVNFSGNMRTRTSYLQRQLSLKPGDPVSLAVMLEEYKNTSDIEIFQSVSLTTFGIEEKKDRADLYIDIVEKKPFQFNIGGGYNSDRGFYANAGLEDRNFLGRYKSLWIKGEASQTGYSSSAGFTEPRLIGTKSSATLSFSVEKLKEFNQSFGTFVYGPAFTIHSVWFDSLSADFGTSYQERKMLGYFSLDDINDPDKMSQFHLRRILLFSVGLSYDRRDSFIRPRNGIFTSLTVGCSVDLSGVKEQLLGDEYSDNFIKYQYNLKLYYTPWPRLTFAAHGMLGYIQPYTSVRGIIQDQLFYLGGIGDVRGFRENMLKYDEFRKPVGGRATVAAGIEARIDLGWHLELTGFFDAGRIDNSFEKFFRMRMSAGLGLRYMTPVGPIGILYGFKINKLKSEDLGMLHVSIGYTF